MKRLYLIAVCLLAWVHGACGQLEDLPGLVPPAEGQSLAAAALAGKAKTPRDAPLRSAHIVRSTWPLRKENGRAPLKGPARVFRPSTKGEKFHFLRRRTKAAAPTASIATQAGSGIALAPPVIHMTNGLMSSVSILPE